MNVGFDGKRAAQNRTGLGNYSRFIVRILSERMPEDSLHLYIPNPKRTPFIKEIPKVSTLHLHYPHGIWQWMKSAWRSWGIKNDLQRDHIDLYYGLSNELPFNIRQAGCLSVVTIHDLIFLRYPHYYDWISRKIYNYKFRKACQMADKIIAVSEFTKHDIMHFYNIPEDKIKVVYQGCDNVFSQNINQKKLDDVNNKYKLPSQYVLYVGSIEERKNVRLVIEALKRCKDNGRPFYLVIVGKSTSYCQQQKAYIKELGIESYCQFFHHVPYEDLPSFYRMATAFVYPSRIEGFGIPMLEAITSGVPAIGCIGSCLEEAGGPSSIYVGPNDVNAMAKAITNVLNNPNLRQRMIIDGKEYAKNFTDEKLCKALMDVLKNL